MRKNFVQKHVVLVTLILCCFILVPLFTDSYGEAKSKNDDLMNEVVKQVEKEAPHIYKEKVVVLDAGHGGYDSGSISETQQGFVEKDAALAITLKIGKYLEDNHIDVMYTRTSDTVSWPADNVEDLLERSFIANGANADYFVSIHTNYSEASQEEVRGNEVWVRYTDAESMDLATNVNDELKVLKYTKNRGLKDEETSPLSLLRFNTMPSILVETGFLSNAQDSEALRSPKSQQDIAEAIAKGILRSIGSRELQE